MSGQILPSSNSRHGLGRALAGVVFSDFIGVLLFALPAVGWLLGLAMMFAGSPLVAWFSLENHPRRRPLVWQIGVCNAAFLVVTAMGLFAFAMYMLSGVQFG